jgi:uncharacterized protein YndB with AHSA1/START domain
MAPIVSSIDISRPPDEVFSYLSDPARFPEWQRDVVRVRVDGGARPGPGERFTTTRWVGGVERTMVQEVTERTPPERWAVRGVAGPIRPSAEVTVEPLDGGAASRVTFALDFEGDGIGRALLPMVRRQTSRAAPLSYRNLKERLERGGLTA